MSSNIMCSKCPKQFDTLLGKKVHEQHEHVYVFKCNFCETKFSSKNILMKHKFNCNDKVEIEEGYYKKQTADRKRKADTQIEQYTELVKVKKPKAARKELKKDYESEKVLKKLFLQKVLSEAKEIVQNQGNRAERGKMHISSVDVKEKVFQKLLEKFEDCKSKVSGYNSLADSNDDSSGKVENRKTPKTVVAFECSFCDSLFKSNAAVVKHEAGHESQDNSEEEEGAKRKENTILEYEEAKKKAKCLPLIQRKEELLKERLIYEEAKRKAELLPEIQMREAMLKEKLAKVKEAVLAKQKAEIRQRQIDIVQATVKKLNEARESNFPSKTSTEPCLSANITKYEYQEIVEKANNLEFIQKKHEMLLLKLKEVKKQVLLKKQKSKLPCVPTIKQNLLGNTKKLKPIEIFENKKAAIKKESIVVDKVGSLEIEPNFQIKLEVNRTKKLDALQAKLAKLKVEKKMKARKAREDTVKEVHKRIEESKRLKEEEDFVQKRLTEDKSRKEFEKHLQEKITSDQKSKNLSPNEIKLQQIKDMEEERSKLQQKLDKLKINRKVKERHSPAPLAKSIKIEEISVSRIPLLDSPSISSNELTSISSYERTDYFKEISPSLPVITTEGVPVGSSQLDNFGGKDSEKELKGESVLNVEQSRQSDVEINIKYNKSIDATTETDEENLVNVKTSDNVYNLQRVLESEQEERISEQLPEEMSNEFDGALGEENLVEVKVKEDAGRSKESKSDSDDSSESDSSDESSSDSSTDDSESEDNDESENSTIEATINSVAEVTLDRVNLQNSFDDGRIKNNSELEGANLNKLVCETGSEDAVEVTVAVEDPQYCNNIVILNRNNTPIVIDDLFISDDEDDEDDPELDQYLSFKIKTLKEKFKQNTDIDRKFDPKVPPLDDYDGDDEGFHNDTEEMTGQGYFLNDDKSLLHEAKYTGCSERNSSKPAEDLLLRSSDLSDVELCSDETTLYNEEYIVKDAQYFIPDIGNEITVETEELELPTMTVEDDTVDHILFEKWENNVVEINSSESVSAVETENLDNALEIIPVAMPVGVGHNEEESNSGSVPLIEHNEEGSTNAVSEPFEDKSLQLVQKDVESNVTECHAIIPYEEKPLEFKHEEGYNTESLSSEGKVLEIEHTEQSEEFSFGGNVPSEETVLEYEEREQKSIVEGFPADVECKVMDLVTIILQELVEKCETSMLEEKYSLVPTAYCLPSDSTTEINENGLVDVQIESDFKVMEESHPGAQETDNDEADDDFWDESYDEDSEDDDELEVSLDDHENTPLVDGSTLFCDVDEDSEDDDGEWISLDTAQNILYGPNGEKSTDILDIPWKDADSEDMNI